MKTKPSAIRREPLKIPKPLSNPTAFLIRDTIAHHGITQAEAVEAMKVHKADSSTLDLPIVVRIDTPVEKDYYRAGGILPYVLAQILA